MVTPGFQFDFQQTVPIKIANPFEVKTGFFAIGYFVFMGFGLILLGISCHPVG
jgi:hypothetical protein